MHLDIYQAPLTNGRKRGQTEGKPVILVTKTAKIEEKATEIETNTVITVAIVNIMETNTFILHTRTLVTEQERL